MAEQPKVSTKQTAKVTAESLENLFQLPDSPGDELEEGSISQLLTDIASNDTAEVKVYRVLVNNKLSWIYDVHPSEFKMSDLRDVYEGGNFLLRIYGIEDGRKVLRAAPRISVEPPKRKMTETIIAPVNQGSDVAQAMATAMQGLGTMMVQGFENLGKLIVQNKPEPVDTMSMQQNFLQQMVIMKQLFDKPIPVDNQNSVEKALDMFTKGMEMGKGIGDVRGEASSTDVLLEAVRSLGPAIMSGIQSQQPPQQRNIGQPVAMPSQTPSDVLHHANAHKPLTTNQHDQRGIDMNLIQKQRLKMGLSFLADAAERDLHVDTYAELALDTLNDDELESVINNPAILDHFAEIEPRINQYKPWFNNLISSVKLVLTDDSDGGTNEESIIDGESIDATATPSDELTEGATRGD